jgi:prepilin peptidase CpaA
MALGFILNGIKSGPHGLLFSLEGIGVTCLLFILFALMGMGAGDIKMLWAIGSLMGPTFTLWTLLCTFIAGGIMGICVAMKRGELSYTIKNTLIGMHVFAATKSTDALKGIETVSKVGKIPYAPAIAIGFAVAAYLKYFKIV